jgi:hypothetical protein
MGIYIKDMEMPTSCGDCRLSVDGWCYACAPKSDEERKHITTNYCPLIPVPKHGRLIDADALMIDLMDRGIEGIQTDDWHEIQQAVADAPTIIPAEEGE